MKHLRKGIILAGGNGTRLKPVTNCISKQLLHIYDKPTIYYSLSLLMLLDIREILIITNKKYIDNYKLLLKDGKNFGLNISYKIQSSPNGIPEGIKIGKRFTKHESFAFILADNIFYGHGLVDLINQSISNNEGCSIFTYPVNDPENYGILVQSKNGRIKKFIEKPKNYISNLAITGLYIFDSKSHEYVKKIKPSKRNELEIVDILNQYLKDSKINNTILTRGISWIDTGTFESLLDANNLIRNTQKNNNRFIGSIEEIAFFKKWISKEKFIQIISNYKNEYGNNLKKLLIS